jgi:hypothetical protein
MGKAKKKCLKKEAPFSLSLCFRSATQKKAAPKKQKRNTRSNRSAATAKHPYFFAV